MAQDVALWGVAYTDVPEVRVPKQGGGMAAFHDVSDTTAQAADVAQGKLFHAADGTLTEGTASGGGGSSWTLLAHREYTFTEEPSTSSTQIDTIIVSKADAYRSDKFLYGVARKRNFVKSRLNHKGTDTFLVNVNPANATSGDLASANRGMFTFYVDGTNNWVCTIGGANTAAGLMLYSANLSGNDLVLNVYTRYISTWGSMIGTYDFDVYMLDWPSGSSPF